MLGQIRLILKFLFLKDFEQRLSTFIKDFEEIHDKRMTFQIRPGATVVRSPSAYTVKPTVAVSGIRPTAPVVQKAPVTTIVKTITTTTQGKTVNATATQNKTIVPSILPKPTAKEKEKKTFSSAGYT